MRKFMKTLYLRRFPNGTYLFYVLEDGVERVLWRHGADGAIDRNVEDDHRADYLREKEECEVYWVRVREPTGSYAMGVF